MEEKTGSEYIDEIIAGLPQWKADTVTLLRTIITRAEPAMVEEIKWRMKTRPEGLAVWSYKGIICFAEVWKDNIKLIFFKGAALKDEHKLFNSRLESKDVRAIELREGDIVDQEKLRDLVREAVEFNELK